jgi:hypothetical protein
MLSPMTLDLMIKAELEDARARIRTVQASPRTDDKDEVASMLATTDDGTSAKGGVHARGMARASSMSTPR